jgi:Concanavalin A-like lectin/glucanases superfamily
MNLKNKMQKNVVLAFVLVIAFASCQKFSRPALGDYPKDTNPPGGPLKFYAAFDGENSNPSLAAVDSIRANFGSVTDGGFASGGIEGNCWQGSSTAFIQYPLPNDFTKATSFTVSLWIKKTPQAAGSGTNFAFALNSSKYSWTNLKLFLEFEDAGNPSTTDLAAAKFYINDQWIEYTKHATTEDRMPNVLNGSWHHLAFTYDETTSTLLAYIDGALFHTDIVGGGLGKADFSNCTGFTIGGPGVEAQDANGWMGNLDGELDQFRLYDTVLSAADIMALYNNKQ